MPLFRSAPRRPPDPGRRDRPIEVLGVVRNLTSATRLLDVLPLLRAEDGVSVFFTVNPGSTFDGGLAEYLARQRGTVLSWREATRRRFDLVVACAINSSMRRLSRPLVVLPHGAGYNRLTRRSTGDATSAAGLSPRELLHRGRVVPDVIGLSHREQLARLAVSCPPALPRARVVGDPCFDRMRANIGWRDHFRELFGAVGGRRLVLLNSTWGPHSLFRRHPELPLRLVRALPVDEYVVAVVLHPNIWSEDTVFGVQRRLRAGQDAGLRLVTPERGWQAGLIAADLVVGDTGSVSFYGAGLARATLLAASGEAELDPRSPMHAFGAGAPRLDPDGDLLAQLRAAERDHRPERLGAVTEQALGVPDQSAELLQELFHELLGERARPPSEAPRPDRYPDPTPVTGHGPTAFDVVGGLANGAIRLARYPLDPTRPGARGFLAVTAEEGAGTAVAQTAEVAVRRQPRGELPPERWLERRFADQPWLSVAVAALGDDRHLLRLRNGTLLQATAARAWGMPAPGLDPLVLGAAVQLSLTEGRLPQDWPDGLPIEAGWARTLVHFHGRSPATAAD
ncbi:hypothetical protein RM844_05150 [Streptomyces sp. DSM 44915]|uniref:Uncharacterized protein n=1 Tax=Streptomyces chisholmiae TaxID=3075540 RepID=A0ABU2JL13_9ACTN|nr:hypothetical protein [Streptomyces sp. DSM 44915]MDT0265675.1 hypothetical protein [Streptomyces sp. DSM 44915]